MIPQTRLQTREQLANPQAKRALNKVLFSRIAPRYDAITRILSFGRDAAWKKRLIDQLPQCTSPVCVDLACGTGDLAFRLAEKYPQAQITGLDLTEAMLENARTRAAGRVLHIQFQQGDMGRTGLPSESIDVVTGGYALRNAGDLDEAIEEAHRILRPGGVAAFLDFSKPQNRLLQRLELLLLRFWCGLWGLLFHGNPAVYAYIAVSLAQFPDRRQLRDKLQAHGFDVASSELHFGGIMQQIMLTKRAS